MLPSVTLTVISAEQLYVARSKAIEPTNGCGVTA